MFFPRRIPLPQFLLLAAFFAPVSAAEEDLSQIQDSKAREAAQAVMEKLANVDEYACQAEFAVVMMIGESEPRRVELLDRAEVRFKRPNLGHVRSETVKHAYSWFDGQVIDMYYDGTFWWQYQQPAADSGEKLADFRKVPAGFERQRIIDRQNKPKIFRYELKAFTDAGIENLERDHCDKLLRPFKDCDLASLTVQSEDNDVWEFTAKSGPINPMGYTEIQLTIAKSNGVLRELHYEGGENQNRTVTITNVQLNPGFDESAFQFTPPEGTKVNTDGTERMVRSLLSQREDWKKRESDAS